MDLTTESLLNCRLSSKATPELREMVENLWEHTRTAQLPLFESIGVDKLSDLFSKHGTLAQWQTVGLTSVHAVEHAWQQLQGVAQAEALASLAPATVIDRYLVGAILRDIADVPSVATNLPRWLHGLAAATLATDVWAPLVGGFAEAAFESKTCHADPSLVQQLPAAYLLAKSCGLDALQALLIEPSAPLDRLDSGALRRAQRLLETGTFDAQDLPNQAEFDDTDIAWLEVGLWLLSSQRRRVDGLPTLLPSVPDGGAIVLDLQAMQLRALQPADLGSRLARAQIEPACLGLPISPDLCRQLRDQGWLGLALHLPVPEEVDEALHVLCDLVVERSPPRVVQGESFRIEPLG